MEEEQSNITVSGQSVRVAVPRIYIAGACRGAGTSTIVLGLVVALKREKLSVSTAVTGCRIIQATQYRRVSGRLCHAMNPWGLSPEQSLQTLARSSSGAELVILEGELGLYDVLDNDYSFSTEAELAYHLDAPVVVVVDGRNYRETIGAIVQGLSTYHKKHKPVGVICNRVDEADRKHIEATLSGMKDIAFLGAVPEDPAFLAFNEADPSGNPSLLNRTKVVAAGELVSKYIDLAYIREIAQEAKPFAVKKAVLTTRSRACRIAVAEDMAFHLTFQGNLDLLRRAGAELVAFSPLLDRKLPERIQALYIPSGYVDLYAAELSANTAMREAIEKFARSGGVIYGEGNAIAYLCRSLSLTSGTQFGMAGVIPGKATLLPDRASSAISADFRFSDDMPYVEMGFLLKTIVSHEDDSVRGVRDYRWVIRPEEQVLSAAEIRTRESLTSTSNEEPMHVIEGLCPFPNVFVTSAMLLWGSNPKLAKNFVDSALEAAPLQ